LDERGSERSHQDPRAVRLSWHPDANSPQLADTGGAYAHYFTTIADCLRRGPVTLDEEFAVAARFGQEFLGRAGHWAQG
jgi:hypothetical protein